MPIDPNKAIDILKRLQANQDYELQNGTPERFEELSNQTERVGRVLEGSQQNINLPQDAQPPKPVGGPPQATDPRDQNFGTQLLEGVKGGSQSLGEWFREKPPGTFPANPLKMPGTSTGAYGGIPEWQGALPAQQPQQDERVARFPMVTPPTGDPTVEGAPEDGDLPPEGTPPAEATPKSPLDLVKAATSDMGYAERVLGHPVNTAADVEFIMNREMTSALAGRKQPRMLSWENLLILLLAGAPAAVRNYQQEKGEWSAEFQRHFNKTRGLITQVKAREFELNQTNALKNKELDVRALRAKATQMRLDKDPNNLRHVAKIASVEKAILQNSEQLARFNLDHQKAIEGLGFANAEPEVQRLIKIAQGLAGQKADFEEEYSAWLTVTGSKMNLPGGQ